MSMISAQIDELRRMADGQVTYRDAREVMLEAADTIWQLRDDLQRTNAENATLREQIHWLKQGDILHVLTDQEYIDQCERERLMQVSIDALDKENAKLRELVARVDHARRDLCDAYPDAEMLNCDDCPAWGSCKGDLADRMRELGVEVP